MYVVSIYLLVTWLVRPSKSADSAVGSSASISRSGSSTSQSMPQAS